MHQMIFNYSNACKRNQIRGSGFLEEANILQFLKEDSTPMRIPTIPPCCSEGRRPVVPKDSGRVFRVIAATCSE